MAYKRPYHSYSYNSPVQVTLSWSSLVGAYDLKFDQIGAHWTKVQAIIAWIKMTIPYGEREYDDINKIWTIHEKFYQDLKNVLDAVGPEFTVVIVEKPLGGVSVKFVPLDTYLQLFKELSGVDIAAYGEDKFGEAKRLYFKTAMKLHPDHHPDDPEAYTKMRDFNEAWDIIKEKHFKIVRVIEQTQ